MGDGSKKKRGEDAELPDFIEGDDELSGELDDDSYGDDEYEDDGDETLAAPVVDDAKTRRSSAPAMPEPSVPGSDTPFVVVKPHSEGLFEAVPGASHGSMDDADFDETFGHTKRSKIALAIIAVVVVATAAIAVSVASNEEQVSELHAFFGGEIVEHKTAEVRKLKARWRDEDLKARNKYGDVTLTYFPQDARVEVTKVTYHQTGAAWHRNDAARDEVAKETIPNDTAKLAEGQSIERLPLLNLPIFESDKVTQGEISAAGTGCDPTCSDPLPYCLEGQCVQVGSVRDVYFYEYTLAFSREGYHPIEKKIRVDDWMRVGPGNQIIEWPGLDLVPKPETVMANFAKAMGEIFCLMKLKDLPTLQAASADENFDMLLMRNGFKTGEDFENARSVLTGGEYAEWWKERQDAIAKQECTAESK